MHLTKQERERLVFGEFSVVAGLMPGGWFCSRPDPEPDILYESDNGVSLAFELVEIIDQAYSNSIERQFDTKDACADYLISLSSAEQKSFQSQYADADIFLGFRPNMTLRLRRNSLPRVFAKLRSLPAGFAGDVAYDSSLDSVLDRISIHRGRFIGPMFDAPSVVRVGDPTVAAIENKMSKSYVPRGDLHLLSYIASNPMFPDDVWLANLDQYFASLDATCQFESIIVYDRRSNAIKRTWRRDA